MEFQPSNIIWSAINFIALIVFLYVFAGKLIGNMIKSKQEKTTKMVTDVEDKIKDIQNKLDTQAEEVERVKKEVSDIETKAKDMSEKLKEDILASAKLESEQLRDKLKRNIENQINRTKVEIKEEVTSKAMTKADKIVRDKLDKDMQVKLIKSFAKSLSESK